MKRLPLPLTLSGLFLICLMLFSLAASAAKLESDRAELMVGEVAIVHLKGAPFIAVVDWKVGPELEILESDSKRARVRAKQPGNGKVICEMNLKTYTSSITVRSNASVQTAPPALSQPSYSSPTYPAPASAAASPQTSLAGVWQIIAAGYTGKLELSSTQGQLIGRVWFDALATWEPLEDLYFDETNRELSFTRPGASQSYRGRLQGNTLEGQFNQWNGRDYTAQPTASPWSATRAGGNILPAAIPAMRQLRIAELTWLGMDEDKVGDWGNGRPNGTPDGHLRLKLDLADRQNIASMSLWSANEKGDKAGGQIWHTRHTNNWMLGVFRDGRQINASHVASLGEFSGSPLFDLYANSSGWFKPGQMLLLEVEGSDGHVVTKTFQIGALPGIAGTWSINANNYTGKLELNEAGGKLSGRVWFDAHQVWEDLRDLSFDGRTLRFLRPGPNQRYTGTLSGNEVRGTFDGGGTWNWVITRTSNAVPTPDSASAREQRLKLVEVIPNASSDTFRRNQRPDLSMHTTSWDRTPYFMAPPRQFDLNLSRIERACLAGDAKGSAGWSIDNYILLELFDPAGMPLGAGVIGGHEGVSQNGRRIAELGSGHNLGPCAVDLKNFLPTGRPFRLKVSAMDYGGVGYASDLWLLLEGQSAPTGLCTSAGQNNLARGKPASQSSTSQWSKPNDAQGAVDGVINGSYAFHTENQVNPWWQVDLGTSNRLSEVRLYNRMDCCGERARTIQVMLSDDGRNWRTLYRHNGTPFGGKDGKPLVVGLNGETARYLRLQLNEANWLHLDEVEVLGHCDTTSSDGGREYTSRPYSPSSNSTPTSNDNLQDALNQLKGLFKR